MYDFIIYLFTYKYCFKYLLNFFLLLILNNIKLYHYIINICIYKFTILLVY